MVRVLIVEAAGEAEVVTVEEEVVTVAVEEAMVVEEEAMVVEEEAMVVEEEAMGVAEEGVAAIATITADFVTIKTVATVGGTSAASTGAIGMKVAALQDMSKTEAVGVAAPFQGTRITSGNVELRS